MASETRTGYALVTSIELTRFRPKAGLAKTYETGNTTQ